MNRKLSWVGVGLGGAALLTFSWLSLTSAMRAVFDSGEARSGVALMSLQGAISDTESGSILSGRSGGTRRFIGELERAVKDPAVKAIVIRVNSPGGSAAASQEMYQAVMRARQSKKVYASMGGVAASGGYYIASACDKIFALPSTLTGSIGVISQFSNYSELMRNVGLRQATIKSGKFKDAGSPTRPLTPEEKALFQGIVGDIFSQFVDDVVAGRKEATHGELTKEKLLELADGRVFTGRQALASGLVDELGGLHEAVQEAGHEAGMSGEIEAQEVGEPSGLLGGLVGASAQDAAGDAGKALGRSFGAGVAEEIESRASGSASAPQAVAPVR